MKCDVTAAESFSIAVEELAEEEDLSLLAALAQHAEFYGISDKIVQYVSRPLKEKLEVEARKNGMFKVNDDIVTIDDCF